MAKAPEQAPQADEPEQDTRLSAFVERDRVIDAEWPGTDTLRPIKFRYKPLDAIQDGRYTRDLAKAPNPEKVYELVREMLARHLVSWDVTDGRGELVDCRDAKQLGRMDGNALAAIQQIVEKSAQSLEEARKNS